jgi:thiol-disulfide isomerase/thioredoxin
MMRLLRFRDRTRLIPCLLGPALVLAGSSDLRAESDPTAPGFTLTKWQTGEMVRLVDFAGSIVVLDFFAYWCAPCRAASREVERGLQRHYAARPGNAHGLPVRVLAVNIERDHPEKTAQFIKETGAEFVVNDVDAALLSQLGGTATPYLVVIDGSRATADAPDFRVRYRRSGFEGVGKLRAVIDSIQPPGAAPSPPAGDSPSAPPANGGAPITHTVEADTEALVSSDIQVASGLLRYVQEQGPTQWKVDLTYSRYEVDYEPVLSLNPFQAARHLDEDYLSAQLSLRQELGDRWRLSASGGAYDGYTSFRSLWLAEYYRQQFGVVPTYVAPDPKGFGFSGGVRWEYRPTVGFAEATFSYVNDQIAPGYDFEPPVLFRGRPFLHTYTPSLKLENVLSPRVRAQHEFQLIIKTGRDPRYAYRGSVNVALGERWVWRTIGGYSQEEPTFEAWFAGSTLEYELTPRWLVSLAGRYYLDTGEIEDSSLLSSAAPGLRTWEIGPALRYAGKRASFKIFAAPHFSDYEPVDIGTRPFANLYKDRTWVSVQAAWAFTF